MMGAVLQRPAGAPIASRMAARANTSVGFSVSYPARSYRANASGSSVQPRISVCAPCAVSASSALRSALDEIPGIGESYQKRLLNHFGSVKAMREASVEDFEKVKGIGHAKAEALYTALHEQ